MLRLSLFVSALFATTALAAPVVEVPEALAPRAACPVTSRYASYRASTIYRETVTVTNGVSYAGKITSTKTETDVRIIPTWKTVFSPSVTTYPGTTTTSYTQAAPTSTLTYILLTETTELPGYAPSSLCQLTTFTNIIPSTTTTTLTYDQTYETVWTTQVGHVSTTTKVIFSTTTRTVTTPGSTAYGTTVTVTIPTTPILPIVATTTSTFYAQGCKTWACQG
ncbi:hypothetical protein V8F33_006514 [Rhypophila sp. PSN 637]